MSGLQWVVDAYILIFASWLLTAGTLGDHLGQKRIFLAGLLLFTIASKLCGAATSLETLIAAHLFQGIGTALMVPASLSEIGDETGRNCTVIALELLAYQPAWTLSL